MDVFTKMSVLDLEEEKNNLHTGKGDKAKALLDRLEALEFYREQEIKKHSDFIEDMEKNRKEIREVHNKLKDLFGWK